jgi:hypothetical protein
MFVHVVLTSRGSWVRAPQRPPIHQGKCRRCVDLTNAVQRWCNKGGRDGNGVVVARAFLDAQRAERSPELTAPPEVAGMTLELLRYSLPWWWMRPHCCGLAVRLTGPSVSGLVSSRRRASCRMTGKLARRRDPSRSY